MFSTNSLKLIPFWINVVPPGTQDKSGSVWVKSGWMCDGANSWLRSTFFLTTDKNYKNMQKYVLKEEFCSQKCKCRIQISKKLQLPKMCTIVGSSRGTEAVWRSRRPPWLRPDVRSLFWQKYKFRLEQLRHLLWKCEENLLNGFYENTKKTPPRMCFCWSKYE